MTNYHCLIIEDEPIAADILKDYINQVPHLKLVDHCSDAMAALKTLKTEKVDLIFLDIHLPGLKGIDFLKSLSHPPYVIMTTAYSEYAVDAFDLEVVDYLTKPIDFSRFLKAVNRIPSVKPVDARIDNSALQERPYRFFNTNRKQVKIFIDDILYIESLKDYIRIHTNKQSIVTKGQLGWIHAQLQSYGLTRIHRSFLVAFDKISAYTVNQVEINETVIPIGGSYRSEIEKMLKELANQE